MLPENNKGEEREDRGEQPRVVKEEEEEAKVEQGRYSIHSRREIPLL